MNIKAVYQISYTHDDMMHYVHLLRGMKIKNFGWIWEHYKVQPIFCTCIKSYKKNLGIFYSLFFGEWCLDMGRSWKYCFFHRLCDVFFLVLFHREWGPCGLGSMVGENRQLVTSEPV